MLIVQELAEWHPLSGKNMKRRKITRRRRVRGGPQRDEEGEKSDLREDYSRRLSAFLGVAESPSVVLVEEGGYEIKIGIVCVGLEFGSREHAGALEHQVAEMHHLPGVFWGEGAICDGGGEFGEETVDFFGGDRGAGGGGEFAGEIGGAKSAVRGVGMRVAEAAAVGVGGEGASASIGESKLATGVCGFGLFRSHGGRIIYCVYSCLVTGSYMKFRIAAGSVRMGAEAFQKGSKGNPMTQVPKGGTWGTRLLRSKAVHFLKSFASHDVLLKDLFGKAPQLCGVAGPFAVPSCANPRMRSESLPHLDGSR